MGDEYEHEKEDDRKGRELSESKERVVESKEEFSKTPPKVRFGRDWLEGQIRVAESQGHFGDLAGKGKPLDLNDDPNWWVKDKLKREEGSFLPEVLQLKRDVEETIGQVRTMGSEKLVRETVETLNRRIRYVNATAINGPPSNLVPLDIERIVEAWHVQREARDD